MSSFTPENSGSEKVRLLVVDDDSAVRLVASEMLLTLNYDVTLAESGEEALKALSENRFAAVLLDVGMPIMNGMEVYEQFRATDDETWVVFMTGYAEEDFNSIDHARTDVLTKPFSMDDLETQLAKIFST